MKDIRYLTNIVEGHLPPTAELILLDTLNKRPAILLADLDGDGVPELIAAYKYQGTVHVIILNNCCYSWRIMADIKGKGFDVSYLNAVPVTGHGLNNLIIGWQLGAIWSQLSIFEWSKNEFKDVASAEMYFSKIQVEDMPDRNGRRDGKYEIALWNHVTGEAYSVEVYSWNNGTLTPDKELYPYYFKRVVKYYEKRVREMPDAGFYWYYLADAQAKAGKIEEAIKSVDRALATPYPFPSKKELLKFKQELLKFLV